MSNPVTEKWTEIKTLIESIDLDVHKNAAGNASAGIRARKGLRLLKAQSAELVKLTVELDKHRKASKN
tara:strand:+ start:3391 stop:3594 length:204 start_codon:yes stop_codon:yes gene_type:complete